MRLDRATILGLDDAVLSRKDKEYLVNLLYPSVPRPLEELGPLWLASKRWDRYLSSSEEQQATAPYRVTPERILYLARSFPPRHCGLRVTDFTGWIYSLYQPRPTSRQLAVGHHVERSIAKTLAPISSRSGWDLIVQDPLFERAEPLPISSLSLGASHLWGLPDLVFRNKASGEIVIVERKATNAPIPCDGWPNVRAQLWAYSHADRWADAPSMILACEVWGYSEGTIRLRAILRWIKGDSSWESQNSDLFNAYVAGRTVLAEDV